MAGCATGQLPMSNPVVSSSRPRTLDVLILKVVALGSIHSYAIPQRIQQISRDLFQLQQGSLYPRSFIA